MYAYLYRYANMNLQEMTQTADTVSDLMKVLSNRNRLMILCQLVEGEKSVGALARLLDLRDASMSQQLSLLRKDGLVKTRREGQTIYYALARSDISELMQFLYDTYCGRSKAGNNAQGGKDDQDSTARN